MSLPVNINEDDLEEIPFRFRDGQVHYYHRETDKVYSKSLFRSTCGTWSTSGYTNEIKFRYCHPEEYKKQQEELAKEAREEDNRRDEFMKRYKSIDEVLVQHVHQNGYLKLTNGLIKDIIENKFYWSKNSQKSKDFW